jgi:hypothetical protein
MRCRAAAAAWGSPAGAPPWLLGAALGVTPAGLWMVLVWPDSMSVVLPAALMYCCTCAAGRNAAAGCVPLMMEGAGRFHSRAPFWFAL